MFVEQVSWTVPQGNRANSLSLLSNVSQYMDASGGLLKALVGNVVDNDEEVVSISFWKSWEDLSRFLGDAQTPLLGKSSNKAEILKRHHFEVIWEWPDDEIDTIVGAVSWILYDFVIDENQVEGLLDELRHYGAQLSQHKGFRETALWLNKNRLGHIVLATQWLRPVQANEIETPDQLKKLLKIEKGQLQINFLTLKVVNFVAAQL